MKNRVLVFSLASILLLFGTCLFVESLWAVDPQVAAGEAHTVALKSDGTLWAWGSNGVGQLGDGTNTDRNIPVQVYGGGTWQAIAAGRYHTVALKSDGTLWAWGDNENGQLGDGTYTSRTTPVQVSGGGSWRNIAAGHLHTVAVKSDASLWAWGYNYYGQLGVGPNGTIPNRNTPVRVGIDEWLWVAAGSAHTVAMKSDATLWAWGYNSNGQLGDGTHTGRNTPGEVSEVPGGFMWQGHIAAGGYHTVALKVDGNLYAWGNNYSGQVGDGTTIDRLTPRWVFWTGFGTAIAAGEWNTLAIKSDGTLWGWGWNINGQLGDGTNTDKDTPVQVYGGGNNWAAIAAGKHHTVALKSDGSVWTWGWNGVGQLGDGTNTDRNVPARIVLVKGKVDFDGDGKTDIAVYRTLAGFWYVIPSGGASPYGMGWGGHATDKPVPGDYDGDGKTDIAVYRTLTGAWYVIPSGGASPYGMGWGGDPTDKPVPGDYDGDGKTDYAVYRNGLWFVYPSGGGSAYASGWGIATDKPVPGDYDGDGKTDCAVYRNGMWFIYPSGGGSAYASGWGVATDKPVPGDYDGDGKTDCAVYRDGTWFVYPSGGGASYAVGWGMAGDKPVPGDYDGDGRANTAVYRPTGGVWYIISTMPPFTPYGVGWGGDPSDVPLATNPD